MFATASLGHRGLDNQLGHPANACPGLDPGWGLFAEENASFERLELIPTDLGPARNPHQSASREHPTCVISGLPEIRIKAQVGNTRLA
jgi:hypothetical protein